jgi:glucokinase
VSTLVLFTLGTGIGGGIILDGEIWRGAWGAGGELGHQILFPNGIRCACGNVGCLEAYASATALVRRFKEARGLSPQARKLKARGQVTARDISEAAKAGDRTCLALMQETGRYLGVAVTNMLHVLNVERVIFTGGMTAAGTLLLKPIRDEVKQRAFPLLRRNVKILFSRMGNDAGLIGAAGCALKQCATPRRTRK